MRLHSSFVIDQMSGTLQVSVSAGHQDRDHLLPRIELELHRALEGLVTHTSSHRNIDTVGILHLRGTALNDIVKSEVDRRNLFYVLVFKRKYLNQAQNFTY